MTTTPKPARLVTTNYVAEMFAVKNATVRVWIRKGLITGRLINGYWRVDHDSLIKFANERYGS